MSYSQPSSAVLVVPDDVLGLLNSRFLARLTIFVCTPLIRDYDWNRGANVSDMRVRPARRDLLTPLEATMFYLATIAITGGIVVFKSFWIYDSVALEHEFEDMNEFETVAAQALRGL